MFMYNVFFLFIPFLFLFLFFLFLSFLSFNKKSVCLHVLLEHWEGRCLIVLHHIVSSQIVELYFPYLSDIA